MPFPPRLRGGPGWGLSSLLAALADPARPRFARPAPKTGRDSAHQVLLDFVDRLLGEVLVDLGDDVGLDVLVQGLAQVGEGARGRSDDECFHVALAYELLQRCRHLTGEVVLLQFVPIGLRHRAAAMPDAGVAAARPVGALLVGRRIYIDE